MLFRSVSVFDIAQTEGDPLPETPRPTLLRADDARLPHLTETLATFTRSRGFRVVMKDVYGTNGRFNIQEKTVYVNSFLPPLQTFKTLTHEVAHALMHSEGTEADRHVFELEAESVAFLVCDSLGLDTSAYSFPYLAGWSREPEEILDSAERACKVADEILSALAWADVRVAA